MFDLRGCFTVEHLGMNVSAETLNLQPPLLSQLLSQLVAPQPLL